MFRGTLESFAAWKRRATQALVISIERLINFLQLTTPWNLTTKFIVAHIEPVQILKRRKSLR